jgi:hypothetical protein
MSGTVNISRDIWQDAAFKAEPFTEREAFVWMVMEAAWKSREKRVGSASVNLERGQLATSIRFMAEAWGWSKSAVDRFLKRLENRDMIGTQTGTAFSLITIRKYNEYQGEPDKAGTPKNEKSGQQRDSSGTNYKKGLIPEKKKEVEANASTDAGAQDECIQHFNEVAARVGWPRVQAITPARRAALAHRLNDVGGSEAWREAITRASWSPLLTGQRGNGWRADFDWLMKAANFTKLMEGNYDERKPSGNRNTGHPVGQGRDSYLDEIAIAARSRPPQGSFGH